MQSHLVVGMIFPDSTLPYRVGLLIGWLVNLIVAVYFGIIIMAEQTTAKAVVDHMEPSLIHTQKAHLETIRRASTLSH